MLSAACDQGVVDSFAKQKEKNGKTNLFRGFFRILTYGSRKDMTTGGGFISGEQTVPEKQAGSRTPVTSQNGKMGLLRYNIQTLAEELRHTKHSQAGGGIIYAENYVYYFVRD